MRKTLAVLVMLFLSAGMAYTDVITIPASECMATFEPSDQGETMSAPDYSVCVAPGSPVLLFQELLVLLPPDVDAGTISVNLAPASVYWMDGEHDVAPAPPYTAIVDGREVADWAGLTEIERGRNTLIYSRDALYPDRSVEIVGIGNVRGYRMARVRYYPYQYNPVTKRLQANLGGNVEVSFRRVARFQAAAETGHDSVFLEKVTRWSSNSSQVQDYYPSSDNHVFMSAEPSATTDYMIVTTSAIVSASTKLQSFINHKTARGFKVGVATETQWGGGTGDTAANKIRAYLKANYISKAIRYVLLVGNPNPSSGNVPMKMLWPRRGASTYQEAPSDYFYADLTGNWDLNGNGYYGEAQDFGAGGVDIYPEVIVGRIPVYGTSTSALDTILQKVIDYESGGIGGDWVKNVLLSMKPSDAATPGYNLGEAIKKDALPAGFVPKRVYQENYGLSPVPETIPCTYTTVQSAWQQHAGFHFWWTHGNETTASDITSSDRTAYLDDRYPSFTFQCSCLNGSPEITNNLGYSLLKQGAVATVSATRVSWYYPGETNFANTDSNAGMTYKYAVNLVRDHMPCGDALYDVMVEMPGSIWMNRCVFNLYGDPSLAYASGPVIGHTPHGDTDIATQPYVIDAQVTSTGPLQSSSPVIRWNTNGSALFSEIRMFLASGITYRGQIPAQPQGTTVYYYIFASDTQSRTGLSPTDAPGNLHSFRVRSDFTPPTILHTALVDTGDVAGPYAVRAAITDDTGVSSTVLHYARNTGAESTATMTVGTDGYYEAQIPGPTIAGDIVNYYITAADSSISQNTSRCPSSGYYSFRILPKIRIAVYNCSTVPPYFSGGNSNAYQSVVDVLSSDPTTRFDSSVVTGLTAADLSGKDALVLPDNGVLPADIQAVSNWFVKGKIILTFESSTSYAAYSGFLWPQMAGLSGNGSVWNTNAGVGDQEIVLDDSITSGYTVGQVIESRGYEAQFLISSLPTDARVLTRSKNNPAYAYAVYRDVPGKGRIIALGPYMSLGSTHSSIVREALVMPSTGRALRVTAPAGGAVFEVGQRVSVAYQTSGEWLASDRVKLEYTTGLDTVWRAMPGAESLAYNTGTYFWDTTGLPGSKLYKVRVTHVGGTASKQSDAAFTLAQSLTVPQSKSIPDGQSVKLSGKIVTANYGGFSFVQEPSRQGGIKVAVSQPLAIGTSVTIVGTMSTIDGERALTIDAISTAAASSVPTPLLMTTAALGGGAFGGQQGVSEYRVVRQGQATSRVLLNAEGLNNIGLLVRIVGVVTAVGSEYFYMNDGGKCDDGSGMLGLRVICGSMAKPVVGSRVAVTGLSGTYYERGSLWRALILPSMDKLQMLN